LTAGGEVYAAGSSELGQLGVPEYQFVPLHAEQPFIKLEMFEFGVNDKAVKVQASDGFSMILSKDGDVYTCGKGNFGRLGHGQEKDCVKPTRIDWFFQNGVKIKDICAGGRHCLAQGEYDGALYGWGFNFYH